MGELSVFSMGKKMEAAGRRQERSDHKRLTTTKKCRKAKEKRMWVTVDSGFW